MPTAGVWERADPSTPGSLLPRHPEHACTEPSKLGVPMTARSAHLLLSGYAAGSMSRGCWLPALPGRASCGNRRSLRPGFFLISLLFLVRLLSKCLPSVQLTPICARHRCQGMLPAELCLMLAPHASKVARACRIVARSCKDFSSNSRGCQPCFPLHTMTWVGFRSGACRQRL